MTVKCFLLTYILVIGTKIQKIGNYENLNKYCNKVSLLSNKLLGSFKKTINSKLIN